MIDGLIGGKMHGKATQRTGQSGNPYYTCKVRTPTTARDALFVNVIAFSATVGAVLMALDDGDSVCLSGALTPKVWTPASGDPRPVLDMVAHAAITPYHVTRKRQALRDSEDSPA